MPYPDRFYPVVDSVDWVHRLFALRVGSIQLRVKGLCHVYGGEMRTRAVTGGGARLVVNDYWCAAIEAGAQHVHLGFEDSAEADFAALRRAGLTIGLSTHNEAELDAALSHKPNYVALGPIYPTTLKVMRFAPQGLERIAQWKQRIGTLPLVAIGGITLERAPAVFAVGADSIAVVSDITQNSNPDARVRAWLKQATH